MKCSTETQVQMLSHTMRLVMVTTREISWRKLGSIFNEMPNRNICPDTITFNALRDGFCKGDKLEEATKLFYEMPD